MRYCQECGNKCNEDMKFCPSCGVKLIEMENDKTQETQETQIIENEQELVNNENLKEDSFQQDDSANVENDVSDKSVQGAGVEIEAPAYTEKDTNTWSNNQQAQSLNDNNWNYNKEQKFTTNNGWNYTGNQNNMNKPKDKKSGLAIASLVLGILSCVYEMLVMGALFFIGFSGFYVLSLILGIIGVVLGVLGIKRSKGISVAGIVINGIAILSSIFFLILGGVMVFKNYQYNGIQNHDHYEDRFNDYYDDNFDIFDDMF